MKHKVKSTMLDGTCVENAESYLFKMTQFEVSNHAKLLSQLDKHSGQNIEYWSKHEKL